jgi:DNA-binding transcriptional MerR regulator
VLDRLRFIRSAQAVGLTLGEIKGVITFREQGSPPCGHVLELIEGRAADLDRRIAELRSLRDDLRGLARRGRSLSPGACSPDLICHILNPAYA